MQSGPVQNFDVFGIQIETLCQQRAQLARPPDVLQRVSQLDYATPLVSGGSGLLRVGARDEVRVILGCHGERLGLEATKGP